ncbi:MAG: peptide-methionine (S)-S-oxide reductase MsrA [Vulcanimicrobiaceae bacterium]
MQAAAQPPRQSSERVVLAGGCFWGMQAVFEQLKGVSRVVAGYSGGSAATAHYEIVSTGRTGHAESVEITYDPSKISFNTLLKVYFRVAHDPTELDYQGPDHGTQYRSVVFYTTFEQQREAQAAIQELERDRVFRAPIVTQIVPLKAFYPAEGYHQDFLTHNPGNPYIVANDLPKLADLRKQYPQLVR